MNKKIESIKNYEETDSLKGALSSESLFTILSRNDNSVEYKPIKAYVSKDYAEDVENKIIIGRVGAVANAFDLKHLNKEEKKETLQKIIISHKLKYPEYDFEIKEGSFPLRYNRGIKVSSGQTVGDYTTMSTHILFIKNYCKFIKKRPKLLIKK